jgi:hypothetical protein
VVSHAGASLVLRTAATVGLTTGLSAALAPWRKPLTCHDPGKVVLDLAVALALGGDCLADIAVLRGHPEVFGVVASDPTVSRLIATLAADAPKALAANDAARCAHAGTIERVVSTTSLATSSRNSGLYFSYFPGNSSIPFRSGPYSVRSPESWRHAT